jgi:hypothetical protein
MKTLPPEKTGLVNTANKDLPFLGYRKYYSTRKLDEGGNMYIPDFSTVYAARKANAAILGFMEAVSKRERFRNLAVDDFQYLMSFEFYRETAAGHKGWDRFENIGLHAIEVFQKATNLREDLNVFIMAHTEDIGKGESSQIVMKTMGKMVRQNFTPEGVFTVVLMTDPKKNLEGDRIVEYRFRTQSTGSDVVKSPEEMFPLYIPNDLNLVSERMTEYYEEGLTIEESKVLAPILEAQAKAAAL